MIKRMFTLILGLIILGCFTGCTGDKRNKEIVESFVEEIYTVSNVKSLDSENYEKYFPENESDEALKALLSDEVLKNLIEEENRTKIVKKAASRRSNIKVESIKVEKKSKEEAGITYGYTADLRLEYAYADIFLKREVYGEVTIGTIEDNDIKEKRITKVISIEIPEKINYYSGVDIQGKWKIELFKPLKILEEYNSKKLLWNIQEDTIDLCIFESKIDSFDYVLVDDSRVDIFQGGEMLTYNYSLTEDGMKLIRSEDERSISFKKIK